MQFANLETQKKLMRFMVKEFLPVWQKHVFNYMLVNGVDALDESVILEEIHAKLYLEEGYAQKEQEIFKEYDPTGFQKFLRQGTEQAFRNDQLT